MMQRRGKFIFIAVLLALALAAADRGTAADVTKRMLFAKGQMSGSASNSVVLGDRDIHVVAASRGQFMHVSIASFENNAVFQIIAPGGRGLDQASDGDDAIRWSGELPADGDYRIVVGGTRGNATYTLMLSIGPK